MDSKTEDLVRLLEAELDFIEGGGYGRSPGTGTEQRPMFDQSLACINHWFIPGQESGCHSDCILMDFVPTNRRTEQHPCHYIALNKSGDTVKSLEETGNQERLEQQVKDWLRATIKRLKGEKDPSRLPDVKY